MINQTTVNKAELVQKEYNLQDTLNHIIVTYIPFDIAAEYFNNSKPVKK